MKKLALAAAAFLSLFISDALAANCPVGGTNNGGFCKTMTSTQVSVDVQVPSISYNAPGNVNPTMSGWVAIGDPLTNATLIQMGWAMTANVSGSIATEAFYEIDPLHISLVVINSNCVGDTTCKVHPFDVMHLDIHCLTNCTANNAATTWSMSITNCGTAGPGCASPLWTWDSTSAIGTITYKCSLAAALFIVEDNPSVFRYPTYGKVVFQNALVNNANPAFDYLTEGNNSTDPNGTWASFGPQNSTGDGFNICQVFPGGSYVPCDSNTYFGKDKGGSFGGR